MFEIHPFDINSQKQIQNKMAQTSHPIIQTILDFVETIAGTNQPRQAVDSFSLSRHSAQSCYDMLLPFVNAEQYESLKNLLSAYQSPESKSISPTKREQYVKQIHEMCQKKQQTILAKNESQHWNLIQAAAVTKLNQQETPLFSSSQLASKNIGMDAQTYEIQDFEHHQPQKKSNQLPQSNKSMKEVKENKTQEQKSFKKQSISEIKEKDDEHVQDGLLMKKSNSVNSSSIKQQISRKQSQSQSQVGNRRTISQDEKNKLCLLHNKQIKFLCQSQTLCLQCLDIKLKNKQSQFQEIKCKNHNNKTLRYKQKKSNQEQQTNLWMCKECLEQRRKIRPTINYSIISSCHYDDIQEICFNKACIEKDKFMICKECPQAHQGHQKIKMNRETLSKQFQIQEKINPEIESFFQKITSMLKVDFFSKIVKRFNEKLLQFASFLKALNCKSDQIEKSVNKLLNDGDKNELLQLWWVRKLQKFDVKKKEQCLQICKEQVQKQLQNSMGQIKNILDNLCNKLTKLQQFDQQSFEEKLNNKYQHVFNTITMKQVEDNKYEYELVNRPCLLKQLSPLNAGRVKLIKISNLQYEFMNPDLSNNLKKQRKKLLETKFKQMQLEDKDKLKIRSLFLHQRIIHVQQIDQLKLDKYEQKIMALAQELNKITDRYYQMQKQSEDLSFILSQKFTNLRILSIQYKLDEWSQCRYAISSRELFKIIHMNENLQEVTIAGVEVPGFDLFIKKLREVKTYSFCEETNIIVDEVGRKTFIGGVWKKELKWMKQFYRHNQLKLNINTDIAFNFSCPEVIEAYIKSLEFLPDLNIKLSSMNFRVNLKRNDRTDLIQTLLQQMKSYESIRVAITDYQVIDLLNSNPFYFLLTGISGLTNIHTLQLNKIIFHLESPQLAQLKICLELLNRNNNLQRLQINNCVMENKSTDEVYRHVITPIFTKLKSFKFFQSVLEIKNNFLPLIISFNPNIESIKIASKLSKDSLNWSSLTRLQYLESNYLEDLCGLNKSCLVFQKLKYLKLKQSTQFAKEFKIEKEKLEQIFSNLQNIVDLQLHNIPFNGSLLLKIPSKQLRAIQLNKCNSITYEQMVENIEKQVNKVEGISRQDILQSFKNQLGRLVNSGDLKAHIKQIFSNKLKLIGIQIKDFKKFDGTVIAIQNILKQFKKSSKVVKMQKIKAELEKVKKVFKQDIVSQIKEHFSNCPPKNKEMIENKAASKSKIQTKMGQRPLMDLLKQYQPFNLLSLKNLQQKLNNKNIGQCQCKGIKNEHLLDIMKKWPQLEELRIRDSFFVGSKIMSIIHFRGAFLKIDKKVFEDYKDLLLVLLMRGTKVAFWS